MKKSLVLCFLIFALMAVYIVPVSAAEDAAKIQIQTPAAMPKSGEEFTVTANLSGNPGFCAIQFALYHDGAELECTGIKLGELLKGTLSVVNPAADTGAIFGAATTTPVTGDGVLATYSFVAKENITTFDFKVRDVSFADINTEPLDYTFEGASKGEDSKPMHSGASGSAGKDNTDAEENEELEPVTEHIFADTAGHWAESYINAAANKGLFKGDESGNFDPDDSVTRAQFVTVLWRMAGSPATEGKTPFADINDQLEEFKSAIAWGYNNGYINGTSETTFEPDGTLTREACMKILHYYSGGKSGMEVMLTAIYDGTFSDSSLVSSWAKPSVYWGLYNKLISGTSDTTLSPQDTATRAQLAKILVNYINTYID